MITALKRDKTISSNLLKSKFDIQQLRNRFYSWNFHADPAQLLKYDDIILCVELKKKPFQHILSRKS